MKIPITKPVIEQNDINSIIEPLKSGWLVQGPAVKQFEKLVSDFIGGANTVATTSCTTALHLSLLTADILPGDHVVIPSFTFVATANSVEYLKARPVFCDINLDSFNIDVNALELILKKDKKIKAIIPVHLFGLCADMEPIMQLASKYKLKIIEDAACALGSFYNNQHAGNFGLSGCLSFHPRKAITTGEGGMIITNNKKIAQLCVSLRDHGASKSDLQRHFEKGGSLLPDYKYLGYNYRMTDIQASLGITQMQKAQYIIDERKKRAAIYNQLLKNLEWLKTPTVSNNYIHSYQSYVCLIKKDYFNNNIKKANIFRNNLMNKLEQEGIATRQGTHAVHTLSFYKNKYKLKDENFLNSYEADRLSVSLPLYAQLTEEEQHYVVNKIKNFGL